MHPAQKCTNAVFTSALESVIKVLAVCAPTILEYENIYVSVLKRRLQPELKELGVLIESQLAKKYAVKKIMRVAMHAKICVTTDLVQSVRFKSHRHVNVVERNDPLHVMRSQLLVHHRRLHASKCARLSSRVPNISVTLFVAHSTEEKILRRTTIYAFKCVTKP